MSEIKKYLQEKQNKKIKLFHGTNRKFDQHCESKNRTVLNDEFQGDWICYTKNIDVAWKYSHAARNQVFDKSLFLEDTNKFISKYPDIKEDFLILTNLLLNKGDDAWDEFYDIYSKKHNHKLEDAGKYFFDKIRDVENNSEFDFNEFLDTLNEVEYSKLAQPDDNIDIFSQYIPQISTYSINFLTKLGFDKSLPENRVLVSEISYNNLLETNSREEAKKAKENGYDLVIYSGEGCVDGEPEYLVANPRQVNVLDIIVEHVKIEYVDEFKTSWTEEKSYSSKKPKRKMK